MLARIARDRLVGAHRRANAADLVRGNRRSDPGAVDHDAGVRFAAGDGLRDLSGDVRVVDRVRGVGAEIVDGDPLSA